jgi:hypothetical protein
MKLVLCWEPFLNSFYAYNIKFLIFLCLLFVSSSLISSFRYTYLFHMQDTLLEVNSYSKNSLLSLWNLKVLYHVHKSPPLDHILSQVNSVCPSDLYIPKVHLHVSLPPMLRSSQWSFFWASQPKPCKHLSPPYVCPTHLILLDLITLTILGDLSDIPSFCSWKFYYYHVLNCSGYLHLFGLDSATIKL